MRFLLDSCISFFAVKDLRENKFEVTWVPETGKDPGDEAIITKAYMEKLVLVTADKDFGELVFFKRMDCPTIIRLVEIPAKLQGTILLRMVELYEKEIENGVIMTVDRYRVRIRHIYD